MPRGKGKTRATRVKGGFNNKGEVQVKPGGD